jgi:hypothetical protein
MEYSLTSGNQRLKLLKAKPNALGPIIIIIITWTHVLTYKKRSNTVTVRNQSYLEVLQFNNAFMKRLSAWNPLNVLVW